MLAKAKGPVVAATDYMKAFAEQMAEHGISLGKPKVDIDKLRGWKESIVGKLTGGLDGLAKGRKVQVVRGHAKFVSANMIEVTGDDGKVARVAFDQCCVAAGSEPLTLPFIPHDDPRVR